MKAKNILFVTHDASRTGAPILLLNLAGLLRDNGYDISFIINRPPYDLLQDFQRFPVTLAMPDAIVYDRWNFVKKKARTLAGLSPYSAGRLGAALQCADLVISNTITNGDILPVIRQKFSGPIVSYVHELAAATKTFTNEKDLQSLLQSSDGFLVPSEAVRSHLLSNLQLDARNIQLLHYYIPSPAQPRATAGLPVFTVGGAGTLDWRKGPDLFVQLAKMIFMKGPDARIRFSWKGAYEGEDLRRLMEEVSNSGLGGKVEFLTADSEMESFYNTLDLFALTSREDPYPLVVLEAAAAAKPTVCFASAGGAPEFIQASNAGAAVPYLDIEAMADRVLSYYRNRAELQETGQRARKHLIQTHANPAYILRQFESVFDSYSIKK